MFQNPIYCSFPKEWTNYHSKNDKQHKANKKESRGLKSSKTPQAFRHKMAQYLAIGDDTDGSGMSHCFFQS